MHFAPCTSAPGCCAHAIERRQDGAMHSPWRHAPHKPPLCSSHTFGARTLGAEVPASPCSCSSHRLCHGVRHHPAGASLSATAPPYRLLVFSRTCMRIWCLHLHTSHDLRLPAVSSLTRLTSREPPCITPHLDAPRIISALPQHRRGSETFAAGRTGPACGCHPEAASSPTSFQACAR